MPSKYHTRALCQGTKSEQCLTVNPLLSPCGGGGGRGLNRDRGEGGLLNLEKTMVSVFPKDLQNKVDKLKYKKVGGHAASDKKQIQTSSF